MKKTILIVTLAVLALGVLGVGVVFAQGTTPPFTGHGPMRNGEGPLHTFMTIEFAKKLDMNVNDINTRLAAGETMYDIALSAGVTAEEFPAVMTEVRTTAIDAAVKANVITQEQADWMKTRGGMMGNGNCDGTGAQSGQRGPQGGHGNGMMGGGNGMMGNGQGWNNQQTNP